MDNISTKSFEARNELCAHPENITPEQYAGFTSQSGHSIQSTSCLTKGEQDNFLKCFDQSKQALLDPNTNNHSSATRLDDVSGSSVAYRITAEQRDKIQMNRVSVGIQKPKSYQGVNRINQILRHIATAIYDQAYSSGKSKNMVEIQCSVFAGKLHISSNFNSHHILEHLQMALNQPVSSNRFRPELFPDMPPIDQEYSARPNRHTIKLQLFMKEKRFNRIKYEIKQDIDLGKGLVSGGTLMPEEMKQQSLSMLNTIKKALQQAQCNNFELITVHSPLHGGVDPSSRETMHAEQNIESYIALIQDKLRATEKNELIIPMAGRFVACATCNEIEHHAQESGIFQPKSGLKLHRSSIRVGMAYPNETQYLATGVVGRPMAEKVAEDFRIAPENLSSHGHTIVTEHAFDTASDTDPDISLDSPKT